MTGNGAEPRTAGGLLHTSQTLHIVRRLHHMTWDTISSEAIVPSTLSVGLMTSQAPAVASAVVFDRVSFAFDDHIVLRDVSFSVPKGSMKILLGASGSGKSVVLKLILGLLRPDSGTIVVDNHHIENMTERDLMSVRADIGMMFQENALFDSLTVAENVGYRLYEETDMPLDHVRRRVEEVLGFVGLKEYIDSMPSELPGGSVAVSRSPGRWPQSRAFCYSTIRRPGSIRSRLPRSTTRS
jgi:ABC-type multidrug transport system fused ATPase/permease subunit